MSIDANFVKRRCAYQSSTLYSSRKSRRLAIVLKRSHRRIITHIWTQFHIQPRNTAAIKKDQNDPKTLWKVSLATQVRCEKDADHRQNERCFKCRLPNRFRFVFIYKLEWSNEFPNITEASCLSHNNGCTILKYKILKTYWDIRIVKIVVFGYAFNNVWFLLSH